jgi:uncharacterized protein
MKALNWLAILGIWLYQRTLSRFLYRHGLRCLHHPSCSQYGILAYKKHGFFTATVLTFRRYQDCHPFSDRPYIDYP